MKVLKFKPGDAVVLSEDGRREIRKLRGKRGTVVGVGALPSIFTVDWGRTKERWNNHEDNLAPAPAKEDRHA